MEAVGSGIFEFERFRLDWRGGGLFRADKHGAFVPVAIGSRALNRSLISTHESPFREFAGIVFNKIVRIILRLPFVDTQCGFKAFRRERCQIIFEQQRIEGFGFDPELLYLARHHGLRAIEIPVRWGHSPVTKVSMLRDSLKMFIDIFVIRWNALSGRYARPRGVTTL